jgi:hypothetical protein
MYVYRMSANDIYSSKAIPTHWNVDYKFIVFQYPSFLGCDCVFDWVVQMFQRIVAPLFLRISQSEMKAQQSLQHREPPKDTESHPWRLGSSAARTSRSPPVHFTLPSVFSYSDHTMRPCWVSKISFFKFKMFLSRFLMLKMFFCSWMTKCNLCHQREIKLQFIFKWNK